MASIHLLGRRGPCWSASLRELRLAVGVRALLVAALHTLGLGLLVRWSSASRSLALLAYASLSVFGLLALLGGLAGRWASLRRSPAPLHAGAPYSFGFAPRLGVLAAFASAVLAQLGALLILKESGERLLAPPEEQQVHPGLLPLGALLGLLCNLGSRLLAPNRALVSVCQLAGTGWLQEHVADISRSLCGVLPGLGPLLLPRINPFLLLDLAGAMALLLAYMLLDMADGYQGADVVAATLIALMTCATMHPVSVYSGKVLLQTTPPHAAGQLDKLLREVSTLDGVLELRNEHFWTLGFDSMAGSVHVRIRRDANEQMVLAHVVHRLHVLVGTLTVQIFKDDWVRPVLAHGTTTIHAMALPDHYVIPMPKMMDDLSPTTSTPLKPASPPPEFAFNTPGRNMNPVILPSTQTRPYGQGFNYGFTHQAGGFNPNFRTGFTNLPSRFGTSNPGY
ncbi:zinc transporter 6 [Ambystoma mexicanum]|uniref:zinc transporter 6 n=1 Tax=Ambystoma mexicanum TaxID=8296 RepID=UPI0037E95470